MVCGGLRRRNMMMCEQRAHKFAMRPRETLRCVSLAVWVIFRTLRNAGKCLVLRINLIVYCQSCKAPCVHDTAFRALMTGGCPTVCLGYCRFFPPRSSAPYSRLVSACILEKVWF